MKRKNVNLKKRNLVARDLKSDKYRPKVVPNKKRYKRLENKKVTKRYD